MILREEMKRMTERPGFNADGTPVRVSKAKRAAKVADKVVSGVLRNSVGRVGGFVRRRILGKLPENAIAGTFQEEKPKEEEETATVDMSKDILSITSESKEIFDKETEDIAMIEDAISREVFSGDSSKTNLKESIKEDEENMVAQ
mmetsp:Transcript_5939/g.6784  ORF Transcript_5939/g.6784 Transcript_5939/m.6784 type:complete len:145 (+) Transcript_5939:523-957(+)